ncbi:S-adenosylmethionine decarboxylase [Roseiconus nitratireducens]|uniref:S-adenosylmethionine decarboxylase n=1 Tax=Roseiconus nitratireducens TaxID=2605748 RepID=A0A5M6DIH3_9BACT|nr:S-adenosylmethionine decarboxylase [Roseiconus nitratireducens]KAA5545979.1 S-adenosylmethionine decarboxylase [Roseiconus nitratireducens]
MEHVHPSPGPLRDFVGGTEWVVDASGCRSTLLTDLRLIRSICETIVDGLGVNLVAAPLCHVFPPPGGVTALYLLSESHLACHTYPEHRFATFNLYCCRRRPQWPWEQELSRRLGAQQVLVRQIDRQLISEVHSTSEGGSCSVAVEGPNQSVVDDRVRGEDRP